MPKEIEPAKTICERCGRVFMAKYAFICPTCHKEIRRENAKRIGLSEKGYKARWGKE